MITTTMNHLTNFNDIVYKIHTTSDNHKMRKHLLDQLKLLVDFDAAAFFLVSDSETHDFIDPVFLNCNPNYLNGRTTTSKQAEALFIGKSLIYRDSDIFEENDRITSAYYLSVIRPNNWNYSIKMMLAYDNKLLGIVALYRSLGKENFEYQDIFTLDLLKEHLSWRLFNDVKGQHSSDKLSVYEAAEQFELTARELDILKELMRGLSNEEICERLFITENTLKKHIRNIYRKLNINNRVQLFKMILEKTDTD